MDSLVDRMSGVIRCDKRFVFGIGHEIQDFRFRSLRRIR
jgi:hypothetical protein